MGYRVTYKALDKGLIEALGPKGTATVLEQASRATRAQQSGLVYHYAAYTLAVLLLTLVFFHFFGSVIIEELLFKFKIFTNCLYCFLLRGNFCAQEGTSKFFFKLVVAPYLWSQINFLSLAFLV